MKIVHPCSYSTLVAYASQKFTHGRNSSSNLFFECKELYSYGRHYLMSVIFNDNTAFINTLNYSSTTNRHLRMLESCLNSNETIIVFKVNDLTTAYRQGKCLFTASRDYYIKQAKECREMAGRARKESIKDAFISQAYDYDVLINILSDRIKLVERFKLTAKI